MRKIVEVEWFDAQHGTDSMSIGDLEQLQPVHTFSVGYLLVERKEYVVLGFMEFENGWIKHHQCIPRGMIQRIKTVGKGGHRWG